MTRTVSASAVYWADPDDGHQRMDFNKRVVFIDDIAGGVSEAEIAEIAAVGDGFRETARAACNPVVAQFDRLRKAHWTDMKAQRAGGAERQFTAKLLEEAVYELGRQIGLLANAHDQEVAAALNRAAAIRELPTEIEAPMLAAAE